MFRLIRTAAGRARTTVKKFQPSKRATHFIAGSMEKRKCRQTLFITIYLARGQLGRNADWQSALQGLKTHMSLRDGGGQ